MTQIPPPPVAPTPDYGAPMPAPGQKSNSAAVGSLICGALSFCIPFITGIVAIVLGVIGIKKSKDPQVGGKGLAIAGIILGLVGIVGWTIGVMSIVGAGVAVAKLTEPGRQTAKDWMAAVSAGDLDKAASLSVDGFPREDIEKIADHVKPYGTFQDMTSNKINLNNNQLDLAGTATFSGGTRTYEIVVVDTGGRWRLQKINIE